jgi:ABC-type branched-subunit amino acid transport system ATPase component
MTNKYGKATLIAGAIAFISGVIYIVYKDITRVNPEKITEEQLQSMLESNVEMNECSSIATSVAMETY